MRESRNGRSKGIRACVDILDLGLQMCLIRASVCMQRKDWPNCEALILARGCCPACHFPLEAKATVVGVFSFTSKCCSCSLIVCMRAYKRKLDGLKILHCFTLDTANCRANLVLILCLLRKVLIHNRYNYMSDVRTFSRQTCYGSCN